MKVNRSGINRGQRAVVRSVPAPVGGWNQRDSLAHMPREDAVILDNWWPTPFDVGVRSGCTAWATGMSGAVETLTAYNSGSTSKLFAVASGSIFDATAPGAVGAALVTGLANSRFQRAHMGTAAGQFLVMVNGADLMQVYNGTGWASIGDGVGAVISSGSAVGALVTITTATPHKLATGMSVTVVGATPAAYNVAAVAITVTGASTFTYTAGGAPGGPMTVIGTYTYAPGVTGIATSQWSNVCMHKQRLWFVQKGSLVGWYLPTSSIGGTAVKFDFGSLFRQGGHIVCMQVWTLDAGYGIDDMLVIITSNGEVAVYKGTDPSTIATWSLVGMYSIGSPMGERSTVKFAGDCLIVGRDGLVPLSAALQSSRVQVAEALSDKIQWAMSTATSQYAANFGWQVFVFPSENMVLVNVPLSDTVTHQYVMNTVSKAWARFVGWTAYDFELLSDELFYGGAGGKVYKAWSGTSDDGLNIQAEALQSYNYFGSPTQLKKFSQIRPMLAWDNRPALNIGINTDFDQTAPTTTLTASAVASTVWDAAAAKWDTSSTVWMGAPTYQKGWQSAFGLGYCAGLHLVSATNMQSLRWASTDYTFEVGGVL
jgi:hypothetical protein